MIKSIPFLSVDHQVFGATLYGYFMAEFSNMLKQASGGKGK